MRLPPFIKAVLLSLTMLVILHSMSSCGNTRSMVYMQGQFDTAQLSQVNATEPVIRKGDILSIIVFSDNPVATQIYNQSLITTAGSSPGSSTGSTDGAPSLGGSAPAAPGY